MEASGAGNAVNSALILLWQGEGRGGVESRGSTTRNPQPSQRKEGEERRKGGGVRESQRVPTESEVLRKKSRDQR